MKIINRAAFLELPSGTIYCKGERWAFENLCVKGDSMDDDWHYLCPCGIEFHDSGQLFDRYEEMLARGASYPMEDGWCRDGVFDHDEIFLIFEKADLEVLRSLIDRSITAASKAAS